VVVALVSLVAVAAVVVAVIQSRAASAARRELESARADAASADQALRAASGERDAQNQRAHDLTSELARANETSRQARRRADELSMLLEAATSTEDSDSGDNDGLWRLLLANVTRRWAAVVGVPPDGRAILAGPPDAQLHQALAREVERLREEVGVDVELSSADPGTGDAPQGDVDARIIVLVAALELLGALASTAQRVTVDVADTMVLTGDGWVDPYRELAAAYERSAAAGAVLGPLDAADESVRLVLHHRPNVTATAHG
jgi:hypothetical protein